MLLFNLDNLDLDKRLNELVEKAGYMDVSYILLNKETLCIFKRFSKHYKKKNCWIYTGLAFPETRFGIAVDNSLKFGEVKII